MNEWSAKKKIWISLTVFLIAVIVLTSFCFILLEKVRQDGQTMVLKKQEAENFFANWKNIESLRKDYENSFQTFRKEPSLLTEETQLNFIKSLEDIAAQTGVRQNIQILGKKTVPASAKTGQPAKKDEPLNLKISLWSGFENFLRYLICLENNPFYNDVALIEINRMDEAGTIDLKDISASFGAGDINAVLNVSVYQK
ncbi:MAG: hypothetical protein UV40_C0038G0008 [Parcubacteria group bacterium GW2011_GWA1_42_7]|nr:MAG: hypothetical protein UV34_C0016G0015 [Parcubacteria group bacterium GW2011_GWB1_42_6]KKS68966.1 MAG: hypothetical protein UV40_C0038G0008 [Parcubacteria group bacterium GW2011_GWA1_42_7]KKS91305.1 MAG: hypothetical protein UV67_C0032G0011 [Parcubacteria group bacterium GW2011_GWC1_43_12]